MKKIITLSLLIPVVSFTQYSPVGNWPGLIPLLFGQAQQRDNRANQQRQIPKAQTQTPSIQNQKDQPKRILFSGPVWCVSCGNKWKTRKLSDPDIDEIVIINRDQTAWIFPKDIFGEDDFLNNDVNEKILRKHKGDSYQGELPGSYPSQRKVIDGKLLDQIDYIGPLKDRNAKGELRKKLEELAKNNLIDLSLFDYSDCKGPFEKIQPDGKKLKYYICNNGKRTINVPMTYSVDPIKNRSSNDSVILKGGKPLDRDGINREIIDKFKIDVSPVSVTPTVPVNNPPSNILSGDKTVEIISADLETVHPRVIVKVKVCIGDLCYFYDWDLSFSEYQQLKRGVIPSSVIMSTPSGGGSIDPKKPLSQPEDVKIKEAEKINKTYLEKRQELINRGMKSEVERIEKELGIPSPK